MSDSKAMFHASVNSFFDTFMSKNIKCHLKLWKGEKILMKCNNKIS